MPEIHKVECGRCDSTEDLKEPGVFGDRGDYRLPEDWHEFSVHHGGVVTHLCPDCWDKYLLIEEEFLSEDHIVK